MMCATARVSLRSGHRAVRRLLVCVTSLCFIVILCSLMSLLIAARNTHGDGSRVLAVGDWIVLPCHEVGAALDIGTAAGFNLGVGLARSTV
jgi:hypothetical protein